MFVFHVVGPVAMFSFDHRAARGLPAWAATVRQELELLLDRLDEVIEAIAVISSCRARIIATLVAPSSLPGVEQWSEIDG